ncbi:MAG: ankyrin repeat domain-containing protein [Bacteroidales bacterium]|nr:ankyrin repeat domain-containing protein [Bacteroidales bacterium]
MKIRLGALLTMLLCTIVVFEPSGISQSCTKTRTKACLKAEKANMALADAVRKNDVETLKVLIEKKGLDVNSQNKNKQTLLIMSVYNNSFDAAKYLLERNADVSLPNQWGTTALMAAADRGKNDFIKLLLKNGADINQTNNSNNTALHRACFKGNTETIALLIKNKANVQAPNSGNFTPILAACWSANAEAVEVLIKNGGKITDKTKDGNTALHIATQSGNKDVVKLLLDYKANANVLDNSGRLPLHYAVREQKPGSVQLLLPVTKKINIQEKHMGYTPLHMAAINGDVKTAQLLVAAGAKNNVKNNSQKTALDYAIKYGYTKTVALFAENNLASKEDIVSAKMNKKASMSAVTTGNAKVVYCGHSGWIVETGNKVLVFDYWSKSTRNQPGLVNGTFNCNEMKNKEVYVFVSHDHGDHYDIKIHEWKDKVANINYIYGFDPKTSKIHSKKGYQGPKFTYVKDNETHEVKNIKFTTLKSTDKGQGFLVEANGISIYHPGDHAWFANEDEANFKKEVDYIASINNQVDIAFLPVSGCPNRWKKEFIEKGFVYNIEKLNPTHVYPMHAFNREYMLKDFAELAEKTNTKSQIVCVENIGDNYVIEGNTMATK